MGVLRLAAATVALTLAAGALVLVAESGPAPGEAGLQWHAVEVVGTEPIWSGQISVHNATALAVLKAAAALQGFDVVIEEAAGFGGCGAYVVEIAGLREQRDGTGWNYYIHDGDGDWTWQAVGAGCRALAEGEAVQWRWIP